MIILGLVVLVIGLFTWRPLVWVGFALIMIGIILLATSVPGPVGGRYW